MDFDLSDDQRLLVESISRMLADNYSFQQRKAYVAAPEGYSTAMWSKYAEMGWLGVAIPEAHGGAGGGMTELGIVMAGAGKFIVLEPLLDLGAHGFCPWLRAKDANAQR